MTISPSSYPATQFIFATGIASLEIVRRGLWNAIRLENEQVANVSTYRATRDIALPLTSEDTHFELKLLNGLSASETLP